MYYIYNITFTQISNREEKFKHKNKTSNEWQDHFQFIYIQPSIKIDKNIDSKELVLIYFNTF